MVFILRNSLKEILVNSSSVEYNGYIKCLKNLNYILVVKYELYLDRRIIMNKFQRWCLNCLQNY